MISNDELISALVSDRERYITEQPPIKPPDAIVVSGDLIQGVGLGTENFLTELTNQYKVAENFLVELTNRFVGGDRSKVIIIPGNHDIDWNTAFSSMVKIESGAIPPNFGKELLSEDSKFRWDWKQREAYKIMNEDVYSARLNSFWEFFERFYDGVSLLKEPARTGANLFELWSGRIGVAAFNSCQGNDCFAFHGRIHKNEIARSHLVLADMGRFELLLAVWHHSVEGPPYRTDYMDAEQVKSMIGSGFRIGLYGHHHRTQATPYQICLPGNETMAMISAGSLCAGRNELPTGVPRQYNIIEIAPGCDSVRVHVREMNTANLFSRGHFSLSGGSSYLDLAFEAPKNRAGLAIDRQKETKIVLIEKAEKLLSEDPKKSQEILRGLDLVPHSFERALFFQAAKNAKDNVAIIEIANPPATLEEFYEAIEAMYNLKLYDEVFEFIHKFSEYLGLPDAQRADLVRRTSTLKEFKK